jgi:hypothetical protein
LAKPHQLHRRFLLAGETMAGETPLVSPAALCSTFHILYCTRPVHSTSCTANPAFSYSSPVPSTAYYCPLPQSTILERHGTNPQNILKPSDSDPELPRKDGCPHTPPIRFLWKAPKLPQYPCGSEPVNSRMLLISNILELITYSEVILEVITYSVSFSVS